jgi:hypothetical protein
VKYPEGSRGAKMKHLHLDKENFKKSKRAIVQIKKSHAELVVCERQIFHTFLLDLGDMVRQPFL